MKNNTIAVFENWWKQYKVKKWDIVTLEKLDKKEWDSFEIKKVLLTFDENKIEVWTPFVNSVIKAQVLESWKWEKVRVFKMKSKKRFSRLYWHRQPYTKVQILSIS